MRYQYRAYIKDQFNIATLPKAFIEIRSGTIKKDLLTSAVSSFEAESIEENINEGDIMVVYAPDGKVLYTGIIKTVGEKKIECYQMQAFYKGLWIYDTHPSTYLEDEIFYLLDRYAQGYQKDANYQDNLIYQEKTKIAISSSSQTEAQLETSEKDHYTIDMEKFIYELYEKYNLVFDFTIPYGAELGSVVIGTPTQNQIKVSDNAECIKDISPTTKIEQINKLIVFDKNGVYRTTFVATTTNGIVEEPSSIVGRYGVVNTKVIYSDDAIDDIKEANIKEEMFNHQITFNLLINNKLYDFFSWKLGQPLQLYTDGKYFDTVFTGYEFSIENDIEPFEAKIVCGKVRTRLTSLLKLGIAQND